jgi:hypothetical protein
VALIGAGVEYTAAASVSRWVDCPPAIVPADLGDDADIMIGPVLDAIWPRLPKRGQQIIKALADESDLIMAAMAWYEWGKALKAWGENYTLQKAAAEKPTRGFTDGVTIPGSVIGDEPIDPYKPFAPDTISLPPM